MAKRKNPVEVFVMICKDCGKSNYTNRLKKIHKGLQLKKYCRNERKMTMHKAKKA